MGLRPRSGTFHYKQTPVLPETRPSIDLQVKERQTRAWLRGQDLSCHLGVCTARLHCPAFL